MKDYETWMKKKTEIEAQNRILSFQKREIWWCSLGLNIGTEVDGKNEKFERPVLILKLYNKSSLLVLPLTTKKHLDEFHLNIHVKQKVFRLKLAQARVVSSKRLLRYVDTVSEVTFNSVILTWFALII